MNRICKVILAAAAVMALAVPAMGAPGDVKLIVKDDGGSANVFSVDNTGAAVATKLGLGTTVPQATFHNAEMTTNPSRGVLVGQHNNGLQAASILFQKSRGTIAAPTVPISGDYIGIFQAQYWNGLSYDRAAQFGFRSETAGYAGPTVGTTTMPSSILFFSGASTQTGDANIMTERMRITAAGNVVVGNSGGVAAGSLAITATNGFLYVPTVAGAVTSCATMTAYTGHAPVWLDTTNMKICSCVAGALKCTAVMN